jgi:hypothetical protein
MRVDQSGQLDQDGLPYLSKGSTFYVQKKVLWDLAWQVPGFGGVSGPATPNPREPQKTVVFLHIKSRLFGNYRLENTKVKPGLDLSFLDFIV